MSGHVDWSKAKRPNVQVKRVNVDFPVGMAGTGAARDTVVSSIRMIRTLKLSLWLPIGVVVLSVIRFGFDPSFSTGFVPMLFSLPAMVFGLVFAWPGGIPLTRALERLHPVSRPATYACAAVLCPLSVGAATIGGLFGPPGIWIYAGIVSLPAWLVLWLLRWRARRLAALGGSEQGEAGLS